MWKRNETERGLDWSFEPIYINNTAFGVALLPASFLPHSVERYKYQEVAFFLRKAHTKPASLPSLFSYKGHKGKQLSSRSQLGVIDGLLEKGQE